MPQTKTILTSLFISVFNQLLGFKCEEILIGGDFNLVLDV